MKRLIVGIAVVVVLAGVGQATLAEDIAPPPYRGDPFSTTQEWDFVTEGRWNGEFMVYDYQAPDGVGGITDNPYGTPPLGAHGNWVDGIGPGPGGAWFGFSKEVSVRSAIPIGENPNGDTLIVRVQVTYYDPLQLDPLNVYVRDGSTEGVQWSRQTIPLGGDWWQLVEESGIRSEDLEKYLYVGVYPSEGTPPDMYAVSEMVIDTVIPEPTSLVLLSMGALALTIGWWRRRRAA